MQVEGPEGDDGQDLDLPELHRRPAQNVVYHSRRRLLPPLPLYLRLVVVVMASARNRPVSAFRRHECSLAALPQQL